MILDWVYGCLCIDLLLGDLLGKFLEIGGVDFGFVELEVFSCVRWFSRVSDGVC